MICSPNGSIENYSNGLNSPPTWMPDSAS